MVLAALVPRVAFGDADDAQGALVPRVAFGDADDAQGGMELEDNGFANGICRLAFTFAGWHLHLPSWTCEIQAGQDDIILGSNLAALVIGSSMARS